MSHNRHTALKALGVYVATGIVLMVLFIIGARLYIGTGTAKIGGMLVAVYCSPIVGFGLAVPVSGLINH
ncbi:MAG: hypothetical protein AAFV33_07935, partial [Chloroflexota bacterium]